MHALRPLLALPLLLLTRTPAAAEAPAAPTLVARQVEQAPIVDGRLDDLAWRGTSEFEVDGGLIKAPRLHVGALTAAGALYVSVRWLDTPPSAPAGDVPAFSTLTLTLGSLPPQTWTLVLDGAAPQPGAAVAGCCGDGGCSVELMRPLAAAEGRAAFLHGEGLPLQLALRARGGAAVDARAVLRRGAAPVAWTFEGATVGRADDALVAALGGKGAPPAWVVRAAGASKVLVQESQDQTDARFPLALAQGVVARDVDLSVRFQALNGWKDRAAGLVWRVKDAGNHYILRANALERNVVCFKMQDGLRVDVPPVGHESEYGAKVAFDPAAWHTLRVVVVGERFEAYLDERLLFHVVDRTFTEPGGVGLWTKSDSVTAFDDLTLVSLDTPAAGR